MLLDEIRAGMIVYCKFPTDEGERMSHYALVMSVEETATGAKTIRVAYGSSKKVSPSGHLPHEFVVSEKKHLERLGLKKPTRFDLRRVVKIVSDDIVDDPVGDVRGSKKLMMRLREAFYASQE